MAKLYAIEIARQICSDEIQIHGGYDYLTDFAVGRYARDARVCRLWWIVGPAAAPVVGSQKSAFG